MRVVWRLSRLQRVGWRVRWKLSVLPLLSPATGASTGPGRGRLSFGLACNPTARNQVNRKASEPVAAFVVFAGDGCQTGVAVSVGDGLDRRQSRVGLRESSRNSFQHPGTTEIESIQVSEFRITRVRRDYGLQPWLA